MFTIKTSARKSGIHGFGVFSEQDIKKGEIIWKFEPAVDNVMPVDEYNKLPQIARDFINFSGYFNENDGGYVICGDYARFTNHSVNPNMEMLDSVISVATRDIKIGDEITENYHKFDGLVGLKLGEFLPTLDIRLDK